MKANTKYNLKNIFGSLISNDCAISAAKTLPWWSTVIVFLLAVGLPLIPIIVSVCNSYGASVLDSTLYNYDSDLTVGCIDLHNNQYEFKVDESYEIKCTKNGNEYHPTTEIDTTPIFSYTNTQEKIEGSDGQYELDIFFTERGLDGNNSINNFVNNLNDRQYVIGTKTLKSDSDPEGTEYYSPSFFVFFKTGFVSVIYKHNSTTSSSTFSGDWKNTKQNEDIITRVLTCDGYNIPTKLEDATTTTGTKDPRGYVKGVLNNWKDVYNESYIETKNKSLLYNTLIYLGVYAALVLFLGLLMFLITRSKKNINRYLKWYQCMAISSWAALAPGILAMAFGFFLQSYAIMLFVLFMGIRAMWISMKQLSPTYQGK